MCSMLTGFSSEDDWMKACRSGKDHQAHGYSYQYFWDLRICNFTGNDHDEEWNTRKINIKCSLEGRKG